MMFVKKEGSESRKKKLVMWDECYYCAVCVCVCVCSRFLIFAPVYHSLLSSVFVFVLNSLRLPSKFGELKSQAKRYGPNKIHIEEDYM